MEMSCFGWLRGYSFQHRSIEYTIHWEFSPVVFKSYAFSWNSTLPYLKFPKWVELRKKQIITSLLFHLRSKNILHNYWVVIVYTYLNSIIQERRYDERWNIHSSSDLSVKFLDMFLWNLSTFRTVLNLAILCSNCECVDILVKSAVRLKLVPTVKSTIWLLVN